MYDVSVVIRNLIFYKNNLFILFCLTSLHLYELHIFRVHGVGHFYHYICCIVLIMRCCRLGVQRQLCSLYKLVSREFFLSWLFLVITFGMPVSCWCWCRHVYIRWLLSIISATFYVQILIAISLFNGLSIHLTYVI